MGTGHMTNGGGQEEAENGMRKEESTEKENAVNTGSGKDASDQEISGGGADLPSLGPWSQN